MNLKEWISILWQEWKGMPLDAKWQVLLFVIGGLVGLILFQLQPGWFMEAVRAWYPIPVN